MWIGLDRGIFVLSVGASKILDDGAVHLRWHTSQRRYARMRPFVFGIGSIEGMSKNSTRPTPASVLREVRLAFRLSRTMDRHFWKGTRLLIGFMHDHF